MSCVLCCKTSHSHKISMNRYHYLIFWIISKFDVFTKPVKKLWYNVTICTEMNYPAITWKHIYMIRHMLWQIQTILQTFNFLHWLSLSIKKYNICYPVNPVISIVIIFVIITYKIISSVCRNHLIWINYIFPWCTFTITSVMKLIIHVIIVITKFYLFSFAYCFIQYLYIVK